jgi:phage terminase Nu1 subunit (DNA packaging protein)
MSLTQRQLSVALEISESRVTRDKARGMPTDSIEAARAWRRDHVRARVKTGERAGRPGGDAPDAGESSGGAGVDYWQWRGRREQAEAELAELKLAEQRGEVMRADAARAAWARKAVAIREGFLQLPARVVPLLVAEPDPARMDQLLRGEIHAVLAQLTEA